MEPTCKHCGTDKFLKVLKYEPGQSEDQSFRTAQGTVSRRRRIDPVVTYFCQKCGQLEGHSVPNDWKPNGDPDVRELRETGIYYPEPGRKAVRTENGNWVITM